MKKISFLDLTSQHNFIKEEIKVVIEKIIDKGEFIGGGEVKNFENSFAKFCKAKNAISVNSGTDALFLTLKALGIGKGDEVITTPFTFIATAEAISNCQATPVFIDIDADTFNIDVSKIEKAITKKTKAIIPVHIFGQIADMGEILKISKKYKLFVIEDACQAVGAELQMANGEWRAAGSIGDAGCFSFFPSKNLGAMGDGGMITTNNKKIAEKIRLLKNHGSSPKNKYKNLVLGINSRLDSLQAGILNIKLKYLEKQNVERKKIADYYSQNLKETQQVQVPFIGKNTTHIFHQYTIKADKRDKLKKYLENHGVSTMVYYPLPLHIQPALKYLKYKKGDFLNTEEVSKKVLSLPIYPELPKKDQDFIIEKMKKFYNGKIK
ncbi:MAG: DegT/DnrJ/EryC1/StrS family aminotransferase [Candidatus Shapirobacteria bacterium]